MGEGRLDKVSEGDGIRSSERMMKMKVVLSASPRAVHS